MPFVSVIMPVYNVERYLRESIESVLNQTYKDFELILVDDGSPDKSPSICDEYAEKDSRVIVIHKKNGGLSSARNEGIEIAGGEYLYMIDSDDQIDPATLELSVAKAKKTSADLIIVGVSVHQIENDVEKSVTNINRPEFILNEHELKDSLHMLIEQGMYKYAWDKLYRKDCIIKNKVRYNKFYDRVCEDTVFLYDLFPYLTCVATVPQICYHYMIRDNQSVVKKYIPERFEKYLGRLYKLSELQNEISKSETLDGIVERNYSDSVLWSLANMFHKDCKLNLFGIIKFYKWMLKVDYTDPKFKKKALSAKRSDTSGTDELLVKLYQRRKPFLMALITVVQRHKGR